MAIYVPAEPEQITMLDHVLDTYQQRLRKAGVHVGLRQAMSKVDDEGNPKGPALKHHGVPCYATVKIVAQKDRVMGLADAVITIDGDRWATLARETRIAILDHECEHLEPLLEEDGSPKEDDCGRPRLAMKPHTYEVGWFVEVAARHGNASIERQQAQMMLAENGQVLFAFMAEPVEEAVEVSA